MEIDPLGLALRWMHILAAVSAVGGAIYARFALLPSLDLLGLESRASLMTAVRGRWAKVVMAAILFLIVSGLWNFFLNVNLFKSAGEKLPPIYQALFGIKFLLALGIFFLASALNGRGAATEKFRVNSRLWLNVTIALAIGVILISGVMRSIHTAPNYLLRRAQPVDTPVQTVDRTTPPAS